MSEQLSYYARDLLEQGQDFVIAKVVDTKGSAPRKKGAVMLMRQDGSTIGTVGGGLLEAETEKLCRKTFETRKRAVSTSSRWMKSRREPLTWGVEETPQYR